MHVLSIGCNIYVMAPHEDTDAASEPNAGGSVPPTNTTTSANWGALRVSYRYADITMLI